MTRVRRAGPPPGKPPSPRLFSPIQVGSLTLRHRTWVPAMVPWRATDDGLVSQDVLDWYERFCPRPPGRHGRGGDGNSRRAERPSAAHR